MDPLALAIALSNRLAELERWSSVLDSWLNRWTTMVVVGVVLEVAFVIWEYRLELHEFRRGTIRSPEKPRLRKYIIEVLGAGLVAMGVAGELVVHTRSGRIDTEMRDITRQQVSIANGIAADANKEAGDARKEAGKARERAAIAELELARLTTPRYLRDEAKAIAALKPFAGQEYDFKSVYQNEDSIKLLYQINKVLQSSGWIRKAAKHGFPSLLLFGKESNDENAVPTGVGSGIDILSEGKSPKNGKSHKAGDALASMLRSSVGLNLGPKDHPIQKDSEEGTEGIERVHIWIGSKE